MNRRGVAADTYDFEVGLPLVGLLEVEALFVPIFYEKKSNWLETENAAGVQ